MMIEILFLMALLFLAALTAAFETSIIAVNRLKIKRLAREGSRRAKIVLDILETPERFFGTILVANNIVDILMASLVTVMMVSLTGEKGKGVFFATLIVTFAIIVSEVTAKTIAARYSERLSLNMARPIRTLIFLLSPVVKVFAFFTNLIVGILSGGKVEKKQSLVTVDEVRTMIKIGEEDDTTHREKYRMLSRVFEFSEAIVKNVMIPKEQMVAINIDANIEEILDKVLEAGYSRLPVYKDNPENIIGIVNSKDLLNLAVNKRLILLHDIVYPAMFILESKKVTELLSEFQKGHTHLALVVSPEKKIKGLVTIEDLLEEIVGEITDEHDLRHHKKLKK